MSQTMIEKMARAMAGADWDVHCNGEPGEARESFVDREWEYYRPEAKAALECLLEPSEGMVEAGSRAYLNSSGDLKATSARQFTAMIRQAIDEGRAS